MLGAGLARWGAAGTKPSSDPMVTVGRTCHTAVMVANSKDEPPGSRPTRWMYENLRSFFSVLMSPTTALMRIRAPSLRQPRSRNEKTVTATQIWRRRFHVPADDLMYEVGRRCLGSFGIVMMSVPKFGRWVSCRRRVSRVWETTALDHELVSAASGP